MLPSERADRCHMFVWQERNQGHAILKTLRDSIDFVIQEQDPTTATANFALLIREHIASLVVPASNPTTREELSAAPILRSTGRVYQICANTWEEVTHLTIPSDRTTERTHPINGDPTILTPAVMATPGPRQAHELYIYDVNSARGINTIVVEAEPLSRLEELALFKGCAKLDALQLTNQREEATEADTMDLGLYQFATLFVETSRAVGLTRVNCANPYTTHREIWFTGEYARMISEVLIHEQALREHDRHVTFGGYQNQVAARFPTSIERTTESEDDRGRDERRNVYTAYIRSYTRAFAEAIRRDEIDLGRITASANSVETAREVVTWPHSLERIPASPSEEGSEEPTETTREPVILEEVHLPQPEGQHSAGTDVQNEGSTSSSQLRRAGISQVEINLREGRQISIRSCQRTLIQLLDVLANEEWQEVLRAGPRPTRNSDRAPFQQALDILPTHGNITLALELMALMDDRELRGTQEIWITPDYAITVVADYTRLDTLLYLENADHVHEYVGNTDRDDESQRWTLDYIHHIRGLTDRFWAVSASGITGIRRWNDLERSDDGTSTTGTGADGDTEQGESDVGH